MLKLTEKKELNFVGIPERSNEETGDLLHKLGIVLHTINLHDLNISKIQIDNIHRLSHNGPGPKPVIVIFVSYLDWQLVWGNKYILANSELNLFIREHFPIQTEATIRQLLQIRRAAIQN